MKAHVHGLFRSSARIIGLAWQTSPGLTVALAVLTLIAGVLPADIAWVAKLIVDVVVDATIAPGGGIRHWKLLTLVSIEAGLVAAQLAAQRGADSSGALLGLRLSDRVRTMVLQKSVTLDYRLFEDPDFYDRVLRVRRDAGTRPISLLRRHFELIQSAVKLVTFGVLLMGFSSWAVLVVIAAGLPAFLSEIRFARLAFDLGRKKSAAQREAGYLENVLSRDDFVKEVKLYRVAPRLLERFTRITKAIYREERAIIVRRGGWGFALGLVGTLAFYCAYAWVALYAVQGRITIGEMTMYLVLFRQAQTTVSATLTAIGGMFGDHLYQADLDEFLSLPSPRPSGDKTEGPLPGDGIRIEEVSFTYPGRTEPALDRVSFHVRPGEILALVGQNGSGKTTLIKLLARYYEPDGGRILLDGLDLKEWDVDALRRRMGVIFQDFSKFKLTAGENIGLGHVEHADDLDRIEEAAERGLARPIIDKLPRGLLTRLGRQFAGGLELSGGQWQKMALARAFMRRDADILVLDEPTAAIDPDGELKLFEHVRQTTVRQMVILISHRFSTVRIADRIVVLDAGRVIELGDHEELIEQDGRYARLFRLQAQAYH